MLLWHDPSHAEDMTLRFTKQFSSPLASLHWIKREVEAVANYKSCRGNCRACSEHCQKRCFRGRRETFSACCMKASIVKDDQMREVKPGWSWPLSFASLGIRTSFSTALRLSITWSKIAKPHLEAFAGYHLLYSLAKQQKILIRYYRLTCRGSCCTAVLLKHLDVFSCKQYHAANISVYKDTFKM